MIFIKKISTFKTIQFTNKRDEFIIYPIFLESKKLAILHLVIYTYLKTFTA